MNKSSKRLNEKKTRQRMTLVHILIAVVAIIECLVLVTFTTFSWIESNSSLIIMNGPDSVQDTSAGNKKLNIADTLNSTINLNTTEGQAFHKIKDFFSEIKYFEFAKCTSNDGKHFFFPRRNNSVPSANQFRRGDTDDYNTSYLYFDFILSNHDNGTYQAENQDVYFDNTEGYEDIIYAVGDGVFSDDTTENAAYLDALRSAMRMSITTQVGNGAETTNVYSLYNDKAIKTIPPALPSNLTPTEENLTYQGLSTSLFSDYVFKMDNNAVTSKKLFVAKKNADTKVSVRIWFEMQDPKYIKKFIGNNATTYFNDDVYKKIAGAKIGLKFAFKTNANDLRTLYFNDYTFSNNSGVAHITDENPNYSVWFYAYQPAVPAAQDHPARSAGYFAVELEPDRTNSEFTRWSTSTTETTNPVTASMLEYLMGTGGHANASGYSGTAGERYTKSYFCYGNFSTKQAVYRWALPAAPAVDNDFSFNAYSYQPNGVYTPVSSGGGWTDCSKVSSSTNIRPGVGQWQNDDEYTTMALLEFRDMATAVTDGNYNTGDNFRFMRDAAIANDHSDYLVYVNNVDANSVSGNYSGAISQNLTLDNSVTTTVNSTVPGITAAMYYDDTHQVFKSYVPRYWLTGDSVGDNRGVAFTYTPGGTFTANGATIRWYDALPSQLNGEYVYTALGYTGADMTGVGYVANYYNSSDGYLPGVGTWTDVEELRFSTELIDADLSAAYRYFVSFDTANSGYYVMIPDATNMTFSAYIPSGKGKTAQELFFARYTGAKTASSSAGATAVWESNPRRSFSKFYPVSIGDVSNDVNGLGYWNLSVLVDGTYENLVYDTLTDGTGNTVNDVTVTEDPTNYTYKLTYDASIHNYGQLLYSYDGTSWTQVADDLTDTYSNMIDRYRFYVPAEEANQSTVYWRWIPYTGYSEFKVFEGTENEISVSVPDTEFTYTHSVADASSTGIYKVVTEAPSGVSAASP